MISKSMERVIKRLEDLGVEGLIFEGRVLLLAEHEHRRMISKLLQKVLRS